jgi:hypothetical protein
MIYITAQLFARPTISIAPVLCDQLTRSHTKDLDFIESNLNNEIVAALSNDVMQNWNIMSQMVLLCTICNDCIALYWGPRGAYVMSQQANATFKT